MAAVYGMNREVVEEEAESPRPSESPGDTYVFVCVCVCVCVQVCESLPVQFNAASCCAIVQSFIHHLVVAWELAWGWPSNEPSHTVA